MYLKVSRPLRRRLQTGCVCNFLEVLLCDVALRSGGTKSTSSYFKISKQQILSLANIPSLVKLLTFSHRSAKFASMMKMLLKLILNILLRPQKDSDLVLENLALRQQLAIWKRHKKRPQIRTKDRLFGIMPCRFWINWRQPLIVVKPETVIRWH